MNDNESLELAKRAGQSVLATVDQHTLVNVIVLSSTVSTFQMLGILGR